MVESNRGYLRYLMPQWGRRSWLSLTPEPERELPRLVATLRSGRRPPPEVVAAEEIRVSRLVLRRGEAAWLRYLHRVVELLDSDLPADPAVAGARARAIEVLANHHNLLLALPGRAARRTAEDRVRLEALAACGQHSIPANQGTK